MGCRLPGALEQMASRLLFSRAVTPMDSNSSLKPFFGVPAVIHGQGMQKVMQLVKRVAQTDATGLTTWQSSLAGEIALVP